MAPNTHFSNEKPTFLMKKWYFFNGRSCLGFWLVWWRLGPARSAPMQRGARFLQKQCFPCSVALVLGRGGGASCRPGALPRSVALVFFKNNASRAAWHSFWAAGMATNKQTINQSNKQTIKPSNKQSNNQSHKQSNKQKIKQAMKGSMKDR